MMTQVNCISEMVNNIHVCRVTVRLSSLVFLAVWWNIPYQGINVSIFIILRVIHVSEFLDKKCTQ
jgi:hypothetical protein